MARLIMVSGYAVSSDVNDGGSYADSTYQMLNPRTSKPNKCNYLRILLSRGSLIFGLCIAIYSSWRLTSVTLLIFPVMGVI